MLCSPQKENFAKFSENASKTLYRWSVFDAETITKQATFRHMQFLLGIIDDFQVGKVHFQKSDIFATSKRKVVRETTSGCAEKPHRPQDPSENHANTIGKRDVFENGAVAAMFLRFRARQTVEIHCVFAENVF